jgi:hypothetical protein
MVAVRDDIFPEIPTIAKAKIAGFPSVIKVSPNGSIEKYNVDGKSTNAIDSAKMRDMSAMTREITTPSPRIMASNVLRVGRTPAKSTKKMNSLNSTTIAVAKDDSYDIYTPVSSLVSPGSSANSPGSLLTTEDRFVMTGGGLSIAATFAGAVQAVGPTALLLAAHALLPKRTRGTYKSPKRASHRGGTRRTRRHS